MRAEVRALARGSGVTGRIAQDHSRRVGGHVSPVWRKSSYSSSDGGECVEVATWRKSSYSNNEGGMCVEVAPIADTLTGVRDSKVPDSPHLEFPAARWAAFVSASSR
ncbi:DUF397 domain-containing protein [Streptodolium elevatio]